MPKPVNDWELELSRRKAAAREDPLERDKIRVILRQLEFERAEALRKQQENRELEKRIKLQEEEYNDILRAEEIMKSLEGK